MSLSLREQEVANLTAKGFSNSEIASRLNVCVKTIKFHLTTIFKKEGVRSRAELIVKYMRENAVTDKELNMFREVIK